MPSALELDMCKYQESTSRASPRDLVARARLGEIAAGVRMNRDGRASDHSTPFRFYDNRQKYLAFVNTCNEKQKVADRAARRAAARSGPRHRRCGMFDAGMGDATVLARLMRSAHAICPTVPQLVVAKEISREDVRLGLEKMADRFSSIRPTVLVVTNLHYADAPALRPRSSDDSPRLNWQVLQAQEAVRRTSTRSRSTALRSVLDYGWATRPSETTRQSRLRAAVGAGDLREDHAFLLDGVIPQPGVAAGRLRLHPRLTAVARARCRRSSRWRRCCCRWCGSLARRRPVAGHPVARRRPGSRNRARSCGRAKRRSRWIVTELLAELGSALGAGRREIFHAPTRPTAKRSSATRCTRCPPRSATASARRCCSPPGMRRST